MVSILCVSHSYKLAKSAVEFVSEMKTEDYKLDFKGGINDGKDFGTDPMLIKEKIESLNNGEGVFLVCDMGSSVMNSQMALQFIDEELQNKVKISKGPFLESLLTVVVTNGEGVSLEQIEEAANSTIGISKY